MLKASKHKQLLSDAVLPNKDGKLTTAFSAAKRIKGNK